MHIDEIVFVKVMNMDLENLEHWHFEMTEKACNELLDLVLQGKKKATSSIAAAFQIKGEEIPQEGSLSVITDWEGNPRAVVRTVRVRRIPYKDIGFDIAVLEGEDDTIGSWRKNHEAFFRAEGKELGYTFTEDMDVIFEEFEVVEVIER